jgi:hypothetical protein
LKEQFPPFKDPRSKTQNPNSKAYLAIIPGIYDSISFSIEFILTVPIMAILFSLCSLFLPLLLYVVHYDKVEDILTMLYLPQMFGVLLRTTPSLFSREGWGGYKIL